MNDIEAAAQRIADAAPPLTEAQRDRLRTLLADRTTADRGERAA